MASFLSRYHSDSGSSESSEGEDDLWGEREDKLVLNHQDLDTDGLEVQITNLVFGDKFKKIRQLMVTNNRLQILPDVVSHLIHLTKLDLSNNRLSSVCDAICELSGLTHLYLRNNLLTENTLPKDMIGLRSIRTLNLSGNRITCLPQQVLDLVSLRNLFLGANLIKEVDKGINRLRRLRLLYLGGNQLQYLPTEIGQLPYLQVLLLSDNRLKKLPCSLCNLHRLQCLHLHQNRLTTLPHNLILLKSLSELSLRGNPLVMRFIREMEHQPSSLLELAARSIKLHRIGYKNTDLPLSLQHFLGQAHECVNPSCSGVYFSHKVEHVKFSDFCGKYKIPLLQYLCSPKCREQNPDYADCDLEEETQGQLEEIRLRRVLLG